MKVGGLGFRSVADASNGTQTSTTESQGGKKLFGEWYLLVCDVFLVRRK